MAGNELAPERMGRRNPPTFVGHEDQGPRNVAHPHAPRWDHQNPLPSAPSSAFVGGRAPTATTGARGGARRRDLQAQLLAQAPDHTSLLEVIDAGRSFFYRPISKKTATNHAFAERLWLDYFTVVLKSEEAAQATLAKGAKLPELKLMQYFIKVCATTGRSLLGVDDVTGWSYNTTRKFMGMVFGMLHQHGVEDPTTVYREQMTRAVETWAKVDKIITTQRKPKYTVRDIDYIRIKVAIHNSDIVKGIDSHFQRPQHSAAHGCMYDLGSRPGQYAEEPAYAGTNEVLCLGHIDWTIPAWDESITVVLYFQFHFMKGMRGDAGAVTHAALHSLPSRKAYYDTSLELLAMAIHRGVFEEDVRSWLLNADLRPMQYLVKLRVKPEFQNQPVFTSVDGERAMHYSTLRAVAQTVRDHFGWKHFTLRTYRYSWAGRMAGLLSRAHLTYLMGHRYSSHQANSTYQAPGRSRDITALRHGDHEDATPVNFHYSHAATGTLAAPISVLSEPDRQMFDGDKDLQAAIRSYTKAEDAVKAETGGRTSVDLLNGPEEQVLSSKVETLVDEAQKQWSFVLQRYCALFYGKQRGVVPDTTFVARNDSIAQVAPLPANDQPLLYYTVALPTDSDEDVTVPDDLAHSGSDSAQFSHSLAGVLQGLQDSHPILPLVLSDIKNARVNVILYFLALYEQDERAKNLQCRYCLDDPKDKKFIDSTALVRHVMSCESSFYSETYTRCNFCGFLIERVIPQSRLKNPQTADDFGDDAVNEHFAQCYRAFATESNNWNPEQQQTKDKGKVRGGKPKEASKKAIIFSRKITIRYDFRSAQVTNWFCPLCLCDETLEWESRQQKFLSLAVVAEHLVSHGGSGGCFGPGNKSDLLSHDMERKFVCRVPICREEDLNSETKLSLPQMLGHYHHVHHIPLLICKRADCPCEGRNSCEGLELLPNFLVFEDDLPLLDDLRQSYPLVPEPDAVLIKNSRRGTHSKAQKDAMRKFLIQEYKD